MVAGLLLTRCTMLADQLTSAGHPPPVAVLELADPGRPVAGPWASCAPRPHAT